MDKKAKILITLVLTCVIAGAVVLQVRNKELVQGRIFDIAEEDELKTPDLHPILEVLGVDENNNLKIRVKVENLGEGSIDGTAPYSYSIYLNDQIILTNTDSFSQMDPGDSFSFIYPIDRSVYSYEDTGTIKIIIDKDNSIKERNEDNNETVLEYSIGESA